MDGGRVAAKGYRYQYLRTVEAALLALADPRVVACRVEGDPHPPDLSGADIVDFDLIDADGRVIEAVQVKSGGPNAKLEVGAVLGILIRLVQKYDADRYRLLTNVALSNRAASLSLALGRSRAGDGPRRALEGVLEHDSARRQIAGLDEEQLERLGRCEISVDWRSRDELDEALRSALSNARRSTGRGIGRQSAGLLLAYLQSEVHRRAASADDAEWRMDEVRRTLMLDDSALVKILGERDWGGVLGSIPPIPDVDRPNLMNVLVEVLGPHRMPVVRVTRCVLTGLSGIGKSSLAAAYAAEHADAYDAIYWVDASNEAAIARDFRTIAAHLGLTAVASAHELRALVHRALGVAAGRWLMILDDAEPRTSLRWVPRTGKGDVLITSIDSTHQFGNSHRIQVSPMSPGEALQLLSARLSVDESQPEVVEALEQLAAGLDYWPLALELVAGYLQGCGYSAMEYRQLLPSLLMRSLTDEQSVPDGYPTTLVTAFDLAATTLRNSAIDPQIVELAGSMLAFVAYLASHRIPVHLLVAPTQIGPGEVSTETGPPVFEGPEPHEAVRALGRVSLVRSDEPLPGRPTRFATAGRTIAVNSVLQEIWRDRIEQSSNFGNFRTGLTALAFHLNWWLETALHNGESEKVHALAPHASVLVGHLVRLKVSNNHVALLLGNLAGVHIAAGESSAATNLLEAELEILNDVDEPDGWLVDQARLHLATALVLDPNKFAIRRAIECLGFVAVRCQQIALDEASQGTVSKFCILSLSILDQIKATHREVVAAMQLTSLFGELMERLAPTAETDAHDAMLRAEAFLAAQQHREAELTCRPYLKDRWGGSSLQLELHRLLLESLAGQDRWHDTGVELEAFAMSAGSQPLYRKPVEQTLHNVGLRLAIALVLQELDDAETTFSRLMTLPCFVWVRQNPRAEWAARFEVLGLVQAAHREDLVEINARVQLVQRLISEDSSVADNATWKLLADATLQKLA